MSVFDKGESFKIGFKYWEGERWLLEMMYLFGYVLGLILGIFFKLNFRSDFFSKIIMRCRIIMVRIKNVIF